MKKNNIEEVFYSPLSEPHRKLFKSLLKKAAESINKTRGSMTSHEHMNLIVMCSNLFLSRTEHVELLHKMCDDYVKTGDFKMPKKTPFGVNCICEH